MAAHSYNYVPVKRSREGSVGVIVGSECWSIFSWSLISFYVGK